MQKQTIDRADSAFHYVNTFNHKVILAIETKQFVHTAQNYNKSMENNGEKPASLEVRWLIYRPRDY